MASIGRVARAYSTLLYALLLRASHVLRQREAAARGEQRLPQIAEPLHARGHRAHREVFDADAAVDLLPRDRRRHGGVRTRARRIDRGERAAPPVLVVVDQHAAAR